MCIRLSSEYLEDSYNNTIINHNEQLQKTKWYRQTILLGYIVAIFEMFLIRKDGNRMNQRPLAI